MLVKDIKNLIKNLDDDFEVTASIVEDIPKEDLEYQSYKYPHNFIPATIEFWDIGYSDKIIRFYIREVQENDSQKD